MLDLPHCHTATDSALNHRLMSHSIILLLGTKQSCSKTGSSYSTFTVTFLFCPFLVLYKVWNQKDLSGEL